MIRRLASCLGVFLALLFLWPCQMSVGIQHGDSIVGSRLVDLKVSYGYYIWLTCQLLLMLDAFFYRLPVRPDPQEECAAASLNSEKAV